jgi:hypothetical protein
VGFALAGLIATLASCRAEPGAACVLVNSAGTFLWLAERESDCRRDAGSARELVWAASFSMPGEAGVAMRLPPDAMLMSLKRGDGEWPPPADALPATGILEMVSSGIPCTVDTRPAVRGTVKFDLRAGDREFRGERPAIFMDGGD